MTAIYFLRDSQNPETDVLLGEIATALAERLTLIVCNSIDELQLQLQEARHAVVFFTPSTEKNQTVEKVKIAVQQFRNSLSNVAGIAIVNPDEILQTSVFESDCLYLTRPLTTFNIFSQLAGAIRQAELLATLNECGQLDEVTSMFNRSYFLKRISEEISLSKRHLSPLACVILGVNYYQMYLDSYGYEFINQLFRHIAQNVQGLVRHEDIIARVGDDEIGIFLPRSTEKGAKIFTNRLVLTLNSASFKYLGYEEEISVCAGIAGYPLIDNNPADADTVVRYARHALHQARCSENEHVRVQLFSEIQPAL